MLLEFLSTTIAILWIYALVATIIVYIKLKKIHKKNKVSWVKSREYVIIRPLLFIALIAAIYFIQNPSEITGDAALVDAITYIINISPFLIFFTLYLIYELYNLYKIRNVKYKEADERWKFTKLFSYISICFLILLSAYTLIAKINHDYSPYVNNFINNFNEETRELVTKNNNSEAAANISKIELSTENLHIVITEKDLVYGVDEIDDKALENLKNQIKNSMGLLVWQLMENRNTKEVIKYMSKDKPLNYVIDYVDGKWTILFSIEKEIPVSR